MRPIGTTVERYGGLNTALEKIHQSEPKTPASSSREVIEAAMAFDGVPIRISDDLPKNRRFCIGCSRVRGCSGLENALGESRCCWSQATAETSTVRLALQSAA